MPAKQVYGKRTSAKPSASYAKFISLDKEIKDLTGKDEIATAKAAERKAGRALKNADANRTKQQNNRKKEADVIVLTDKLEELRIDKNDAPVKRSAPRCRSNPNASQANNQEATEHALTCTQNAASIGYNGASTRTNEEAETTALVEGLIALDIREKNTTLTGTLCGRKGGCQTTKQTPIKPSPIEGKTVAKRHGQVGEREQQTNHQAASATPTSARKLKAVVIPCSKPMLQLPSPDSAPDPKDSKDPYLSYVSPLLSLQSFGSSIVPFRQWSTSLEPYFTVAKIAEASFSEVYRLSALSTACRSMKESVLKLVPLRSPPDVPLRNNSQLRAVRNRDAQAQKEKETQEGEDSWKSYVEDVHSEIKLLQNLNYIPGFTNFRELTVLQGRPSKTFIEAWRSWNKARPRGKKSEFPDPSKKASYNDTQLWAVIEMQDAGTDVEKVMDKGGLSTIWEVWDVFWGVCLSVAKAEEACRFEHRDLHLENICIRSSRSESGDDLLNPIIKDPLRRKLGFTGLETTVIDYTLSRADVSSSTLRGCSSISADSVASESSPSTPSSQTEVAFLDLNKDMGLFTGDASKEYQYEIYRYMRGAVLYNDPLKSEPPSASNRGDRRSPRKTPQHIRFDDHDSAPRTSPRKHVTNKYFDQPSDIWRDFHPKTNLLWAHFILYKLLEHLEGNKPANLSSKQVMRNVETPGEEKSKVMRKALKLYKVLERVADLLEPSALAKKDSLGSMKELAVLAMEERWLRVDDVAGA